MSERVIYLPERGPRLSPEQLRAALGVPAEHPMLRAVTQLLDDVLAGAVLAVSDRGVPPDERAHAAGAIDVVLQLRAQLEELRAEQAPQSKRPPKPPVRGHR